MVTEDRQRWIGGDITRQTVPNTGSSDRICLVADSRCGKHCHSRCHSAVVLTPSRWRCRVWSRWGRNYDVSVTSVTEVLLTSDSVDVRYGSEILEAILPPSLSSCHPSWWQLKVARTAEHSDLTPNCAVFSQNHIVATCFRCHYCSAAGIFVLNAEPKYCIIPGLHKLKFSLVVCICTVKILFTTSWDPLCCYS